MRKLEELKTEYEASTPGEWRPCRDFEDFDGPLFEIDPEEKAEYDARPYTSIRTEVGTVAASHDLFTFRDADAKFIALAHNLMPQLLEAARELANFVEYLVVAADDDSYAEEIDRAMKILRGLK